MRELQEKQKMKRRLYSLPALVLLSFITFLFVRGTYVVFKKKTESGGYVETLEVKAAALRAKEKELQANIQGLRTPEGLEKEVKEKYNVAKEGEHVVILVDKPSGTTTPAKDSRAWYQRMWSAILGAL